MALSLLELIQIVSDEIGIPRTATVVGSTDPQAVQLLALANRLGADLARDFEWRRLIKEHSFNTANGTQDYDLPTDYDRTVSDTQWDRTNFWPNAGPKSSQEWQWLKGGILSTGPRFRWRIFGNKVRLHPVPTGIFNVVYEYVSRWWALTVSATDPDHVKFTADNDFSIYPDDLMIHGIKFYWREAKGLDYAMPMAMFDATLSKCKAQDQGMRKLNLAPRSGSHLLTMDNVPETGFGS